jgi:hypothetical protein
MKKVIELIKKKKIVIIISLICAIIVVILVVKGMNKLALLATAIFLAGNNCKDLFKNNKKIDKKKSG